jgi:hypothetical protein
MPRSSVDRTLARLTTRAVQVTLTIALAGCHHRAGPVIPMYSANSTSIDQDAEQARGAAIAFVTLEAQGSASADSLLAVGADFIMTGIRVTTKPRLAGFNGAGTAAVEEENLGLAGSFAWVVMTYRFIGRTPDLGERARATFILEKQRAGWRIRHVHSSMVARW